MDPLDDFFNCCPELVFTADRNSTVIRLSASLAHLVGPEAQCGTRLVERVHPDDRETFNAAWSQLSESFTPPFTFRLQRADAAYQMVSCSARRSAAGGEIHGSLREGAERTAAEITPHAQAELLRVVEDNIPIAVWAVDREGIFIHHAGKGLETAGLTQGQFLGMNIFELYRGSIGTVKIREAFAGQIGHTISKQHDVFWETWYIPVRDARGEITRVAGVTLDISAVTRAEQELREKIDLIERQQQVIRELSTPIIEVWDKVLTLPLSGVIDSARASDMMESLLARVSEKGARFAVIDLTGVDSVDTGTAAHLIKLIQALRLLGTEGIIAGIQSGVAQTMVTLGIDLAGIVARANLRESLQYCIRRMRAGGAQAMQTPSEVMSEHHHIARGIL